MEWKILEGVPEADVQRVLDMARRRTFRKGEVVFHEGDPGDTLHLVRSGRFAVKVSTQYADEAILAVLRSGDIFGELALLSPDAPRSATVTALEAGETMSVHQLDFGRLRREQPGVGDVLISVLSAQVRRLSRHLLEALYTPADTRVRRRVLELVDIYTDEDTVPPITIPEDARAVTINPDGEVYASFDDEVDPQLLGTLTLAGFVNQKGLEAMGGNLYLETPASGQPLIGAPGEDGRGTLRQGYLEASSVDAVREISDLISAQRGYELNAKVITAADQMLGATTQIR